MFEMRREAAIQRAYRPVVRVTLGVPIANVDHRLDGDTHALAQHRPAVHGAVVGDLRALVHGAADAMADVLTHDGVTQAFDVLLDRRADVADPIARPRLLDAAPERLFGNLDELLRRRRDLAGAHGQGRIADEALVGAAEVQADDVALLDHALAGYAMHDLVVYGDADGSRIALITEEGRDDAAPLELLAHQLIQLQLADTGADVFGQQLQHLGIDATGVAHDGHLLLSLEDDWQRAPFPLS